jgi:hypothetical protein
MRTEGPATNLLILPSLLDIRAPTVVRGPYPLAIGMARDDETP